MNLTYRQILTTDFSVFLNENQKQRRQIDQNKLKHNLKVVKFLDEHKDISDKAGFSAISKMTYKELFEQYFESQLFKASLEQLKREGESEKYIKLYMNKCKNYVKFFSSLDE